MVMEALKLPHLTVKVELDALLAIHQAHYDTNELLPMIIMLLARRIDMLEDRVREFEGKK